jgi:hypothetical protein
MLSAGWSGRQHPGVSALVRRRSPEVSLPRFIWETLREGLEETLGM